MDYPDLKNTESLTYTDDVMKSFKTVEILKSHVIILVLLNFFNFVYILCEF